MNKHMKIVVIGGSGLIGKKLVNNLRQHGHEVVAASPSSGVNTITGEGLAKALTGAQVDAAGAPLTLHMQRFVFAISYLLFLISPCPRLSDFMRPVTPAY
jgi:NAD(P)-dependent dehydrogenase (short-subunit alcohol dehydrogenase family)